MVRFSSQLSTSASWKRNTKLLPARTRHSTQASWSMRTWQPRYCPRLCRLPLLLLLLLLVPHALHVSAHVHLLFLFAFVCSSAQLKTSTKQLNRTEPVSGGARVLQKTAETALYRGPSGVHGFWMQRLEPRCGSHALCWLWLRENLSQG